MVISGRSLERVGEAYKLLNASGGEHRAIPGERDLAWLKSIRRFAESCAKYQIAAFVCNAGIWTGEWNQSEDSNRILFAANYREHFQLVRFLLESGRLTSGRLLVVSSGTHDPAEKNYMTTPTFESS